MTVNCQTLNRTRPPIQLASGTLLSQLRLRLLLREFLRDVDLLRRGRCELRGAKRFFLRGKLPFALERVRWLLSIMTVRSFSHNHRHWLENVALGVRALCVCQRYSGGYASSPEGLGNHLRPTERAGCLGVEP